jgi:hypothetical protein
MGALFKPLEIPTEEEAFGQQKQSSDNNFVPVIN